MPLVEDDYMVETLTSNGADHPFDQWDSATGRRGDKDLLHPETVDASVEVHSVDLVSIPYQGPRHRVPWKSIDHLLRRPFSRRMFGDIEMNDTATVVAKTMKTNRTLKVAVGKVKKSSDTKSFA